MYSEISNAMEGFFTPVGEINAIVNASNTDTKLMTYLSLLEGLKSDPSTYKRSITIKESNVQYILVVNSSVDRMIADNTIFNGIPTKIFIYPESVTIDDGSNREVHKYIMDTIAIISKSFHDIFDFKEGTSSRIINMYANIIIAVSVFYETYKARVNIERIYEIIKEAYYDTYNISTDSSTDSGDPDAIIRAMCEVIVEKIPEFAKLVQEVGVHDLLDCGYIVGDYSDLKNKYSKKLMETGLLTKIVTDGDNNGSVDVKNQE